jgi:hypothetical protein
MTYIALAKTHLAQSDEFRPVGWRASDVAATHAGKGENIS